MIDSLLEYKRDFLDICVRTRSQQATFKQKLSDEVKTICSLSSSKVQSQYVCKDPSLLYFPCQPLSKFPTISQLLTFVNEQFSCDLNACVVNNYSEQSRVMPHADDESYVDQSQPICTFTIGSSRDIYFYEQTKAGSPKLRLHQLKPEEGSVYVMHPTFQSLFKHQVQPGSGPRMSISFRRVKKSEPNPKEWPYMHPDRTLALKSASETSTRDNSPTRQLPPEPPSKIPASKLTGPDKLKNVCKDLNKEECKNLIVLLNNRITELEQAEFKLEQNEIDDLVELVEQPLDNSDLDPDARTNLAVQVLSNLAALDISQDQNNVSTCWLMENPANTPFLEGKKIDDSPGIKQLLDMVKTSVPDATGLNSCLISHYPNGNLKTRLHSDKSAFLCESSPICNYSFGETRDIAFYNAKLHSGPPVRKFTMNSRSLLIMRPGCQDKLKHVVLPDPNVSGNRFCISFRKTCPISSAPAPDEPVQPPTTILIGTSITTRINPAKIVGKSSSKFVNCSTRGDFIRNASEKVDKLYAGTLTDFQDKPLEKELNIQNIIFSVGTNDIRKKSEGVSGLFYPLRDLLSKTRKLFPGVKIYVQSVIPMGFEYRWTPRNVLDFNELQRRCVREISNCCYIDVLDDFLDRRRQYPLSSLYFDTLHPSPKGCAVLARAFIKITRDRNFDLKL